MTKDPYLPSVMSDVVIDISHYENVSQNFVLTVKFGVAAVFLKATQGSHFVDPTFLPRVSEARDVGLLVGAYHFADGSNPAAQAAHFLTVAKSQADVDCLAVDWEPYLPSQATEMQTTTIVAAIQAATGRWPIIYMNRYMLAAPNLTLLKCDLWLAEYGDRPICPPGWSQWKLWQHTDGTVGTHPVPVPGVGRCDRSRFAGTVGGLKSYWPNSHTARREARWA